MSELELVIIDDFCINLLQEWGLNDNSLVHSFIDKGIDTESLKCLTLEDVNILIPEEKLGLRSKFRQKLFEWRHEQGFATPLADTLSMNSSISSQSWITSSPFKIISPDIIASDTEQAGPSKLKDKNTSTNSTILDLQSLLNGSLTGKDLLKKKCLTSLDRKHIIQIICEYWLNNNYFPQQADYHNATSQIIKIFEKETEELYIGNNTTRGILVQKFYSLSKKYQSFGLVQSRYNLKRSSPVEPPVAKKINLENIETQECTEDMVKDRDWLKFNKTPENLVFEKWNNTFQLREKDLKQNIDLFLEWPILKQNIGSQLIELDFERKYPSKNNNIFSKWDDFTIKIKPIFKNLIKDSSSKILLQKLDNDNSNTDLKNYIFTILLNSVLVPTIIKEGKTVWKPTIIDGQNGLAVFVNNVKEIPFLIKNRREKYLDKNLTIQPFIVVVGESKENLENFYIHYNETFYECENFLKTLSVCFQIHQVLNIEYAKECLQVWHFIEYYFFDFPISGKKSNALISVISDLTN